MLLIKMTCDKSGSWNGKSASLGVVNGKVIHDLPKDHHISKMLKESKNNCLFWGFYFEDGWDYSVTIQKIHYSEKPKKHMQDFQYPQIIELLLRSKYFAKNNSFFSVKKAFDYIKKNA